LPGSVRTQLKVYPSLVARILESMEALLTRPYGCGEQTISSTYPNLLLLTALKQTGLSGHRLETRALANLRAGSPRLPGYQNEVGAFPYWGHGDGDVSLTAYALEFLRAAKDFVEVDEDRVDRAVDWLRANPSDDRSSAALRARSLAGSAIVDRDLG